MISDSGAPLCVLCFLPMSSQDFSVCVTADGIVGSFHDTLLLNSVMFVNKGSFGKMPH